MWFLSLCVVDFLRNLVIFVLDFVLCCCFGVCLFWYLRFLVLMWFVDFTFGFSVLDGGFSFRKLVFGVIGGFT